MTNSDDSQVRTFLLADIRGYTRYTADHGDEAAAELASRFAGVVRDGVEARGGRLLEMRGDEALAVFASTRSALRAALELQERFGRDASDERGLPLPVGMGIDVGEAVPVEGGYRGAALNTAARLCALAGPGEILVTQAVGHLAGKMEGVTLTDQGPRQLKGLAEPIPVLRAHSGSGEIVSKPIIVPEPIVPREVSLQHITRPRPATLEQRIEEGVESFGERIEALVQRSFDESIRAAEDGISVQGRGVRGKRSDPANQFAAMSSAFISAAFGLGILVLLAVAVWFIVHLF